MIYIYKIFKRLIRYIKKTQWIIVFIKLKLNNVHFFLDIKSNGIPKIDIGLKASMTIGNRFIMNNGGAYNMIGRQQPCTFVVWYNGQLHIGNNVGISSTSIVCWDRITIEDNVRIGGGTVIYDTDFHSLNNNERIANPEVKSNVHIAPIIIMKSAFIGAHCTILKGVTIGENSIVGACSVVTKNIPSNEVWAGNPARFIKKIQNNV